MKGEKSMEQYTVYRRDFPQDTFLAAPGSTARVLDFCSAVDRVEGQTARDAAQVYLNKEGLRFQKMVTVAPGVYQLFTH